MITWDQLETALLLYDIYRDTIEDVDSRTYRFEDTTIRVFDHILKLPLDEAVALVLAGFAFGNY